MALTDQLTAIGNAIRAKTGGSALIPLNDMPTEIANIPGGNLPAEALTITGNCNYRFAYNGWNWFITQYGNQVTTSNITSTQDMFMNITINVMKIVQMEHIIIILYVKIVILIVKLVIKAIL